MNDRLDIVLFGATGFTGKRCIPEIHKLTRADGRLLTWGVAGRSEVKLRKILLEQQNAIGSDLSSIPIITADINNEESLEKMTASARIIINCCGPYRLYGEPVIKACLKTGTHQVDVTGEPQYMETIQLKYHKLAQEKGIYIVSSCGCDSIPADLGVIYLQNNFKGTLNSIEAYLELDEEEPTATGPYFNYATWVSAVHGIAHADELSAIRQKLQSKRFPNFVPKLKSRGVLHKSNVINAWSVPFLGSDRSVILRSQRYLYEQEKLRPVQVHVYEGVKSLSTVARMAFYGNLFLFLAKYKCGRKLLLQHPKFFSGGLFSHEEPNDKTLKSTKYSITLHGEGWNEKVSDQEECKIPPNKTIIGSVSCINPAYGITCTTVTLAAIMILTESDKLPNKGGVYPPGAAFAKTSLTEQLQKNGLTFQIKSKL